MGLVGQTEARADGPKAIAERIICKTEARRKVELLRIVQLLDTTDRGSGQTRVEISSRSENDGREQAVPFLRSPEIVVANANVQREPLKHSPVVLEECAAFMHVEVTRVVRELSRVRVDCDVLLKRAIRRERQDAVESVGARAWGRQ